MGFGPELAKETGMIPLKGNEFFILFLPWFIDLACEYMFNGAIFDPQVLGAGVMG